MALRRNLMNMESTITRMNTTNLDPLMPLVPHSAEYQEEVEVTWETSGPNTRAKREVYDDHNPFFGMLGVSTPTRIFGKDSNSQENTQSYHDCSRIIPNAKIGTTGGGWIVMSLILMKRHTTCELKHWTTERNLLFLIMPQTTISHLPSIGVGSLPLLLEMTTETRSRILETKEVSGNPMWSLHTKMRRLTNTLSKWSRLEYGDIFAKAKEYEEQVRVFEETLILYLEESELERSILAKTRLHWFKEGDANTKYFHALMRGRRRRLFIHKICTDEGDWIQGDDNIAKEACQYFQNIFTGHNARISEGALQCIPRMRGRESINYLGCPLYIGGQRIIYYSELVDKVVKKISGWHSRILSFGGRVTLVKHVLQSIPIHTMAAISPPKTTIKYLKNITADFFWGMDKEKKKYHWASWETLSYPCDEGGIGVRLLSDICTSFQYKQWWIFRTKNSLWGQFLKAKYCQRANPVAKKWDTGQSLVWKYLLKNRPRVEPHITWKIYSGSSSFWWDNWLGSGPLADLMDNISSLNNLQVSYFIEEGQWKESLVRQHAPPLMVPTILNTHIQHQDETPDEAIWTPADSGHFSISCSGNCSEKSMPRT
ncbi:hypothetical protein H5410_027563 [Solanum commersonii]|uniref:Uncharacterized protein n=1 Tax=Solanum commersonii TaxID=4109 RepID=A0A9J5Z2D5_SOLCO|nr:hypothetical protein H5410_027563 [Solanum commersonii]